MIKDNLYSWKESNGSPQGYQFDMYAGNTPITEEDEVIRKRKEREKRTGKPLKSEEVKISETARFVNDMYEFSNDRDDQSAKAVVGPIPGETFKRANLNISINDFRKAVVMDLIKAGKASITKGELYALNNNIYSAFENSADEQTDVAGGNQSYSQFDIKGSISKSDIFKGSGIENPNELLSQDEALGELAYATGGLHGAVRYFKDNEALIKDREDDFSSDGIISGVELNEYSKEIERLKLLLKHDEGFGGRAAKLQKEIDDLMSKKPNEITIADVQNFQTNTKIGRRIKAKQLEQNKNLLDKVAELDKKSNDMYGGDKNAVNLLTVSQSRMYHGMRSYLNEAKNLLESTRPGSVDGVLETGADIGKSIGMAAYTKGPNWYHNTVNAFSDIFGMTDDPRKVITKKIEDYYGKLLKYEYEIAKGKVDDVEEPIITEQDLKNILSKEEFDLLSSFSVLESANQLRVDNQSLSWKVGQGVYDSGQFIIDMWIGGKGVNAAAGTIKAMKGAVGALKVGKSFKGVVNAAGEALNAGKTTVAAEAKLAEELGTATKNAVLDRSLAGLKSPLIKSSKYIAKTIAKGPMMTGTYASQEQGEWEGRTSVETSTNGYYLSTRQKFNDATIEDYAAEAASNSLSAFVEAGGAIRPAMKFISSAVPALGKVASWSKGIRTGLGSSVSNFINRGAAKMFHTEDLTGALSKLWKHPFAESLHVDSMVDEFFEEWEEHTLRGGKQKDFFEKDNLIVTAATVGIFSGFFGAVKPVSYANSVIQKNRAEKDMDRLLSSTFGFSGNSLNNIKSLIDNTPVSMLSGVVMEIVKRANESAYDLNNNMSSVGTLALINKASNELNKSIAKYVTHNYKLSVMRENAPKDINEADAYFTEAFGSIEGDIAKKAVANIVNEDTGNVEKVFIAGLQREVFLLGGVNINSDGSISEKFDENGQPMKAKIMYGKNGSITESPFKYIAQEGVTTVNKDELIAELADFNTKTSVANAMIDPDGNASKRSDKHKKRVSIVEGSEDRHPIMNQGKDADVFLPNLKDEQTGEIVGGFVRLVKDDESGTYRYLRVDQATGKVIDDTEKVEPVETTTTELELDSEGRKVVEVEKKEINFRVRAAIEEQEDEDEDGDDETNSASKEALSIKEVEDRIRREAAAVKRAEEKAAEAAANVDFDSTIPTSSIVDAALGNTEEVFHATASDAVFTQRYDFDFSALEDEFDDPLGFLEGVATEEAAIIINKLKRDASARKVDRVKNEYASKTLIFVNKKERGYRADGKLASDETVPEENSKIMLNEEWYDNAEVSISSIVLHVNEGGVTKATRTPLITLTDPATGKQLLFTLKSRNMLDKMLAAGEITPIEHERGLLLRENIMNAVKSKSGIDLAIGLGKPKMSSFRLGRKKDADGAPVPLVYRTIQDTNTGDFTMNQNEFRFCFRSNNDRLLSYGKGDTAATDEVGINDIGSLSDVSMSMLPPMIENAKRDYTPLLGPVIDESLAAIVAEAIKAPKGTPISQIVDALGNGNMFGFDKFINGVLLNSRMTTEDFLDMFLTARDLSTTGLQILSGNLYDGNKGLLNIKKATVKEIEGAVLGLNLNINLSNFFDEQANLVSPAETLKVDESVANDFFGNDLHTLMYEMISTTGLDYGFYDPPFLFISERSEFLNSELEGGGVTINGITVPNSDELPQEIVDVINAMYNKKSKYADDMIANSSVSMDELLKNISDYTESQDKIDFKATTDQGKAAKNTVKLTTELALKWLATKLFKAEVITDKAVIKSLLDRLKAEGKLSDVQRDIIDVGLDGFVYEGKVYLETFDVETYGHEMAHLLVKSLKNALPKKDIAALDKSIKEFAATNPKAVAAKAKDYKGEYSPELEYFCDEFGFAFERNMNVEPFRLSIAGVFKGLANVMSFFFGFRPASLDAAYYNYAAKYAFKATMSDFQFIKAINDSNLSLPERCAKMVMFCKKTIVDPFSYNAKVRREMADIKKSVFASDMRFKEDGLTRTNLTEDEWLFTKTKAFKKATKNGVLKDDAGEPVKLYIDPVNPSIYGFATLKESKGSNSNVSGFLLTSRVHVIANNDEIHKLLNDRAYQQHLKSIIFDDGQADAIMYEVNCEKRYILKDSNIFMSSALTDRDIVEAEMNGTESMLRARALSMHQDGYSAGSIIAATGFFPTEYGYPKGAPALIKINFNDERINMAVVNNAIRTGAAVNLGDLYTNEELLNATTKKGLKVKILVSNTIAHSNVQYIDDTAIITVNGAANKNDYKQIARDVIFNIIGSGGSVFNITPFYVTTNTNRTEGYFDGAINNLQGDERLTLAFSTRDTAIDMWVEAMRIDPREENMAIARSNIFEKTGWFMSNYNSMTASIFIDYKSIADNVVRLADGSFSRIFKLKDFMPDFVKDGSMSNIKVIFDPELKQDGMYYNSSNTIKIGKPGFKVNEDGTMTLNRGKVIEAVGILLHEASHAASESIGTFISAGVDKIIIQPDAEIKRNIENLKLVTGDLESADKSYIPMYKRRYAKIALNVIEKLFASGGHKMMTPGAFVKLIDKEIDEAYGIGKLPTKSRIRTGIKKIAFENMMATAGDGYLKDIDEASAIASESSDAIFHAPIFRMLSNFGKSIPTEIAKRYKYNEDTDNMRGVDLFFSVKQEDDKPTVDVSTAFKSISRAIINSAVVNLKKPEDLKVIAANAIEMYKKQVNISGSSDINSIVNKHVSNLIDSLSSTVTDFYSFIKYIPYEYAGILQFSNRDEIIGLINEALSKSSSDRKSVAIALVSSVNKLLLSSDSKVNSDSFVAYFSSLNLSKVKAEDVINNMSKMSISRTNVGQKSLKDFLYNAARNSLNVNSFMDSINTMATSKDPIAIGVVKMSMLAANMGMTNFYERLYTQFNQLSTSFLNNDTKNMTDVQLIINKGAARNKVNSIIKDMTPKFIEGITNEALTFSGADTTLGVGNNTDGIILFFERLSIPIDKRTADILASQYIVGSVSGAIKEWSEDIINNQRSGISSTTPLGKALDNIAFIGRSSDSASIKKDGSTYPAMSKFNAISQTIEDMNGMSNEKISEFVAKNSYRQGSALIDAMLRKGNRLKLHKQIDTFVDFGDAAVSDILHLLSGYVSLGKISTDGTRYYISGHNIFEKYLSYNYEDDSKSSMDRSTDATLIVNKTPKLADFFASGSIKNTTLVNGFNKYAYAEISSILDAHKAFSLNYSNLIDGFHVKNGKAGAGCEFTEYMDGIRLAAKSPDGAVYSGLNDAIEKLDEYSSQFLGSAEGVESMHAQLMSRTALKGVTDSKVLAQLDLFEKEIDAAKASGYLSMPGAFSRLMIKKMLIVGGVNISGLKTKILNDVNETMVTDPEIAERLSDLGFSETSSIPDIIGTAYLYATISKIEASKLIFGSPAEYGNVTKLEKRTQSFNTTYSIPVNYGDSGVRPNGEDVPIDFKNNEFICEFAKDLEKESLTGPYTDVDDTLGTVMVSPAMYREMLIRSRGWSEEAQEDYDKLIAAGKSGGDLNSVTSGMKFNPLKLIYVGEYIDDNGVARKTMIKAQFVPLFNDKDSSFGDLYEKFTNVDASKRVHMYAMRDSVKTGFSNQMIRSLKFENLGMISIPRDEKKVDISLIRKLLLFNDPNFHSAIESSVVNNITNLMNDMINSNGVIDAAYLKTIASDEDGIDLAAGLDEIIELQKEDPTINPLDFVGMFDLITKKINTEVAKAFDFKMKGIQCSAVTERLFTPKPLEFVNSENTMDVMVPMDYFGDIVKGLSYNDAIDKLTKLGYIGGPMSSCMVVRNPAQAHSSISPAKIVGVFPRSYGYCISAPSEFLKANGGDYDGDKYFLFSASNEGSVESNRIMYDLLRSQRKTMEGNVDADMDAFTTKNSEIERDYTHSKKTTGPKNVQTAQYKSEVSGLGLVGVCVNMISGLLSFLKHDVTFKSEGKKISKTKSEVDGSLSVVSALFSLAVDIATNPLLQDLGVSSRVFKTAFAIAAVSDMDTTVKFLHSNLTKIKPEADGMVNFQGLMSVESLNSIITDALENPTDEPTAEQQVLINTMSKLGTIFITLKHADDFYDFIRNNGYFDSVLQSAKIKESMERIAKYNNSVSAFKASNVSASGISSALDKLDFISNVLSGSSSFMTKEFITKFWESMIKEDTKDDDYFDEEYTLSRKHNKTSFEGFKTKIVLDKISAYVSEKIGKSIYKSYGAARVEQIKKYMIENHNISFTREKTYIHSVTASDSTLYNLGEAAEPGTLLGDFFSIYYASAAQTGAVVEENKRIKALREGEEYLDDNSDSKSTKFMRHPGKIISMKHAVKFGVSSQLSNTLSQLDIKNFKLREVSIPMHSSDHIGNMISARTPVEYDGFGNNRIDVQVNTTVSSGGEIFDKSEIRTFNVKGEYTLGTMYAIKDLIYAIENNLPFVNTNLSESIVSAVLAAIKEGRKAYGDALDVHIASNDNAFVSKINSGVRTTNSTSISDANNGSVVITKNLNNVEYTEPVYIKDDIEYMDVYNISKNFDITIINISKNVIPQSGFGFIKAATRDADLEIRESDIDALVKNYPGYAVVNLSKQFKNAPVEIVKGSVVTYQYTDSIGEKTDIIVTVNERKMLSAPNGDMFYSYTVTDMDGGVHVVNDFNDNILKPFTSVDKLNKLQFPNVIVLTEDASRFKLNRVSNINNYIVAQIDQTAPTYKPMNIPNGKDNNKMCTI